MKGFIAQIRQVRCNSGAATSFILINGLVVAAIAFVVLHFMMGDMKATEARNLTRDVVRATEMSVTDIEKTVSALGYFYASLSVNEQQDGKVSHGVQKLLTGDALFSGILWTTESGVWRQEDIQGKTRQDAYSPDLGWPGYQDLYKATFELDYNHVGYLRQMPWPAFKAKAGSSPAEVPAGLVMKVRLPDGTLGIVMAVTTPPEIFGDAWAVQRDDLARIMVRDRETGEVILDNKAGINNVSGQMFSTVSSGHVLGLGDRYWDLQFEVIPTTVSKFMSLSPWIALGILASLTLIGAVLAERKHRQDMAFEEMSKTLEGTHSELVSKTTERDRLFLALRKSERENRAVINAVSDVIFETDENGKIVFLNETWNRMTEQDSAASIGKEFFSLVELTDRARQRDMFAELLHGERHAYRTETKIDMGGGRFKPVEIAFSMLRMAEDKSLRVVGTITDMEKRHRAEMALREAEQRYRAIFENSISGIYQTSPEGRFISANPALAEVLGYASADELMESITDIGRQVYARPEERKAFEEKLLFEGKVSGVETEVRRKDGKHIWIMENARVVRSDKGTVHHYEGSIWDVTERHEAEEAMRRARMEAEMSIRSRLEFLSNMSHELRTPLNAVIGFSEILKEEVMGPLGVPAYKEYAQDIYESGHHLLKIISEILEVSKIETGMRDLNVSNFKLPKILNACQTILASRIDQSGVDLKVSLPDDLPELLAEELAFKQIMLNLVGNAVKFTPKGGHVTVTAQMEKNGEMVIDVTDTGAGMTESEIAKAMQPFGKVDASLSASKSGTGLGLTIVDSLVRLHGGRFRLLSQKGVGTTARVIMPGTRILSKDGTTPLRAVR